MTLKKSSRAGLLALAFGILLGLFLSAGTYDASYAQTPAAPAPADAPAPAPAPPQPACDATAKPPILKDCKTDSGDTAWMLTSMALVLMMTIPGLALFYGGMVRKKNVLATVMQSFTITCIVTVLWMVIGYSWAFTDGSDYLGGTSRFLLMGMGTNVVSPLAATIPESVYMCFQMTFAIITPALIAGAFAERMKFSAMLLFTVLWSIIVYSPIAHWVWGGGFLGGLGVLDFAGGTVVHINAGVAGLVCALVLGKRKGFGTTNMAPHNLVISVIGASLLWVGWFGFNAGSELAADGLAGAAMINTQVATAAAALVRLFARQRAVRAGGDAKAEGQGEREKFEGVVGFHFLSWFAVGCSPMHAAAPHENRHLAPEFRRRKFSNFFRASGGTCRARFCRARAFLAFVCQLRPAG